jgi:hypothetical protein
MNNTEFHKVTLGDFSSLGFDSNFIKEKIDLYNLSYRFMSLEERDEVILIILKFLNSHDVVVSGIHRKNQWENGWAENLNAYRETRELKSIIPKYFGKYKIQRLNGKLIIPKEDNFEIKLVSLFQYLVFEKYFKLLDCIYEFGAGTGHNLLRMREINPNALLYSMEWTESGVDLLNSVAKDLNDSNLKSVLFDNFEPDENISLSRDAGVYTFASLEQLGDNSDRIINYWMKNKPSIIVNIEPMAEPLDDSELLQYLSIQYFNKRRYLKDYIVKLKELEKQGKIIIHEIIRTGIGSYYIEGYSIVAWSPI